MIQKFSLLCVQRSCLDLLPLVFCPGKQSAVLCHVLIGQMTAFKDVGLEGRIVLIPVGIIPAYHNVKSTEPVPNDSCN